MAASIATSLRCRGPFGAFARMAGSFSDRSILRLCTKDHKIAGSDFGRQRRLRGAKVAIMDGRDQSAPIDIDSQ